MWQITHLKQQHFLFFTFYITHKDFMRKSCVFICHLIGSVVKIVLYLHFLYTKDNRVRQIKKKHDWWNNRFSDCNWTVTLLKKRLWYRCFPVNFAKFLRMSFLTEHLRWLLLFIDGTIPLCNFEFPKKEVPLLTRLFFWTFSEL